MAPPDRMRRWVQPSLMLITDRTRLRGRELEEVVSQAVEGGVTCVQLREKDLAANELYELALTLRAVVQGRALLFVNDRLDVAQATGADGVHLPERGLLVAAARHVTGESCIIGRSVHGVEAAVRAERDGADYVQVGTVYETASHPGLPPAGIELVRAVAEAVRIPIVAVGGITAERVPEVIAAGADGVAVIGAIMDANDPCAAARALREALE
jgi:thiamine-phosphate pyrophosphorylase